MKARHTLVAVWLITGMCAVGGSVLGAAVSQRGLFIGAMLGGPFGALLSVWICTRLHWLAPHQLRAATIGAILGFLIAAPIAAANLHGPVLPVLLCSLAGVGALAGAGRASATKRVPHGRQLTTLGD